MWRTTQPNAKKQRLYTKSLWITATFEGVWEGRAKTVRLTSYRLSRAWTMKLLLSLVLWFFVIFTRHWQYRWLY